VHLSLPFAARFCQQNGFMHAGAIASVADSANGYAAYTLTPPKTDVLGGGIQDQPAGAGARRFVPGLRTRPSCLAEVDRLPG
jgi:hypothetical protein